MKNGPSLKINPPKVSVIIPSLNGDRWIEYAIKSILNQTYFNYEIIVVDGGSTDKTESIVKSYGNRISFISKPGLKTTAAHNVGIETARGDLICFLDVDDEWVENKLELQVAEILKNPELGLIYSDCYQINETGQIIGRFNPPMLNKIDFLKTLYIRNIIPNPTIMVPKKCFEAINGYDETMLYCEDYDMWMRIALKYDVLCIPTPLAKWRIHDVNRSFHEDNWIYENKLTDRFELFNPEFKKYRPIRESRILLGYGNYYNSQRKIELARSYFWKSIRCQPLSPVSYVQLLKTFLPSKALSILKKLKTIIFH